MSCKKCGDEGPPHFWGDEWPYWDHLYRAESELHDFMHQFKIYYLSTKEKYGSIRYELLWIRYPILKKFNFIENILLRIGFRLVRYKVMKLVEKYPFMKEEILEDFWEFDDD